MAASIPSPTTKHQKLNVEPVREDPSKFYYHFLYKAVTVAIFLVILPLFPSQAPEFINQSLLTRNWELLHLLFVGIAISYGLFSRRRDETEKENNGNPKFETPQSYVSRFLQVSSFFEDESETETQTQSGESKVQTWSNYQYHRNEPVVVVAPKHSNFYEQSATSSRISEKPLLLPVRSLKYRVSDSCSVQSVNESQSSAPSVNGSSFRSGSRRFSRNAETEGPKMEDSKLNDNTMLPSPIPWRSESLTSQTSRSSRSNSMSSSQSQFSPKAKEQSLSSESLAKNSEDMVKKKGFYKPSPPPPPPPPPPPVLFKSISMKPKTSSFEEEEASFHKEMKRSFTSERRDNLTGRSVRRGREIGEEEMNGIVERSQWEEPTRKKVTFMEFAEEEDKDFVVFEEDTETEEDVVVGESSPNEGSPRTDGTDSCRNSVGEEGEGPDVDKKADEFIAKFREQIRLQRIDSIKRSARMTTRNSSR